MIFASGIATQFEAKPLFSNVSVKFGGSNRYGLTSANGCGKSTFMKILGGELETRLVEQRRGKPQQAGQRPAARRWDRRP